MHPRTTMVVYQSAISGNKKPTGQTLFASLTFVYKIEKIHGEYKHTYFYMYPDQCLSKLGILCWFGSLQCLL